MEKYLIIYHDKSNDNEFFPELLNAENHKPILKDSFNECENEIKKDIEYWKQNRRYPSEVTILNNGYMTTVSDSYGSCSYYIRKIIIE